MNTHTYVDTHTHTHKASSVTGEYFHRKFPNTPGDWPPVAEKAHSPLAHTHMHFRQPDEIALQSNRTINSSAPLHGDSAQLSHCFCMISLQHNILSRLYLWFSVWTCASALGRGKVLGYVTSVVFVCHAPISHVTFHPHPANTIACSLILCGAHI